MTDRDRQVTRTLGSRSPRTAVLFQDAEWFDEPVWIEQPPPEPGEDYCIPADLLWAFTDEELQIPGAPSRIHDCDEDQPRRVPPTIFGRRMAEGTR